jgi:hypothetical protein
MPKLPGIGITRVIRVVFVIGQILGVVLVTPVTMVVWYGIHTSGPLIHSSISILHLHSLWIGMDPGKI